MIQEMRDALERELVSDALQGDTTVLAEILANIPDHIIYASLSDEAQSKFEPIPSDCTTIELNGEEAVEVIASNLAIMIKHNDVGVSVDYSARYDGEAEPFRADQCWFEDVPEGEFMCNSCGGGFYRDEIETDEDGDDYCKSCK